jgi:hypothetical protein
MNETNAKLDEIMCALSTLSRRMDRMESVLQELNGDTKDLHQYVPFVGWLSDTARKFIGWNQSGGDANSQVLRLV